MTTASRELELLVDKIQKQLAPQAEVIHDVRLDGRISKTKRQIDVLVRERIGQYVIQIIIDCKDHNRPIDVKGVEEFYGLLKDVGAQKGVLVCPKGFTEAAKNTAEAKQLDLYSPFDTDAHKWQVRATMPAFCDFRSASVSFRISCSAPYPFKIFPNFFERSIIYDAEDRELGTASTFSLTVPAFASRPASWASRASSQSASIGLMPLVIEGFGSNPSASIARSLLSLAGQIRREADRTLAPCCSAITRTTAGCTTQGAPARA